MAYEDNLLAALAESLTDIDGLQESAYLLSNPTPPTAEIIPGPIDYDRAFQRGLDLHNATVRLTVGTATDLGAQKRLGAFRAPSGPDSIKEAIEMDPTLGGLIDNLHVTRCGPVRQFRRPNGDVVLGCDFDVTLYGSPAS